MEVRFSRRRHIGWFHMPHLVKPPSIQTMIFPNERQIHYLHAKCDGGRSVGASARCRRFQTKRRYSEAPASTNRTARAQQTHSHSFTILAFSHHHHHHWQRACVLIRTHVSINYINTERIQHSPSRLPPARSLALRRRRPSTRRSTGSHSPLTLMQPHKPPRPQPARH